MAYLATAATSYYKGVRSKNINSVGAFTLCAWVDFNSTNFTFMCFGGTSFTPGWGFEITAANKVLGRFMHSNFRQCITTGTYSDGFHHVAYRRGVAAGTSGKIYVDGFEQTVTNTNGGVSTLPFPIPFGNQYIGVEFVTGTTFAKHAVDVRIAQPTYYPYHLTASEILALFHRKGRNIQAWDDRSTKHNTHYKFEGPPGDAMPSTYRASWEQNHNSDKLTLTGSDAEFASDYLVTR